MKYLKMALWSRLVFRIFEIIFFVSFLCLKQDFNFLVRFTSLTFIVSLFILVAEEYY